MAQIPSAPGPWPPAYPDQRPSVPGAVVSLVCGIVGVAVPIAGLVLGIIAIVQSRKAKAALAQNPGTYGGGGMATAGLVLGIIAVVVGSFWALYIVCGLVFLLTWVGPGHHFR